MGGGLEEGKKNPKHGVLACQAYPKLGMQVVWLKVGWRGGGLATWSLSDFTVKRLVGWVRLGLGTKGG